VLQMNRMTVRNREAEQPGGAEPKDHYAFWETQPVAQFREVSEEVRKLKGILRAGVRKL
jgi:hypothetical protein